MAAIKAIISIGFYILIRRMLLLSATELSRMPYTNDLESVESFEKHLKEFLGIKELALAWEDIRH